ncbi:hypothetical protein [Halomonas sp.]|uniref:hypothetical protein n=1 Tax=Halomonas sp. TaxID=1486246 RepID=UPI00261CE9CB|nr:hypothetical protein [Halomonas sp.]
MPDRESLVNKGVVSFGSRRGRGSATSTDVNQVVVIGTARGGTSLVAGALHHLGVYLGEKSSPPVFEDVRLARTIEKGSLDEAKDIVKEYSDRHPVLAFKRPSVIDNLSVIEKVFDCPRYIFVYKDIFSISNRNSISMLTDVLPGMERALKQYRNTVSFLRDVNPEALLVSYEKALRYPEHFVDRVIEFCGISPTPKQVEAARKFINPEPRQYLDVSRVTKSQGRLAGVKGRVVHGWARYVHRSVHAEVNILVNDALVARVVADQPRPDLDKRFGQSCAFSFTLPEDMVVQKGDSVRARVSDDVLDISNSPIKLS